MANDAKKTYRLYVLPMNREGIKAAGKERFYRATPSYILAYTDGEITAKHAEITAKEAHRLSRGDMEWLRDCIKVIVADQIREKESEIATDINKRLDELEAALKAEKMKLEQEG